MCELQFVHANFLKHLATTELHKNNQLQFRKRKLNVVAFIYLCECATFQGRHPNGTDSHRTHPILRFVFPINVCTNKLISRSQLFHLFKICRVQLYNWIHSYLFELKIVSHISFQNMRVPHIFHIEKQFQPNKWPMIIKYIVLIEMMEWKIMGICSRIHHNKMERRKLYFASSKQ